MPSSAGSQRHDARVQVTQQVAVTLNVEPINQWGDMRRIDTPSPVYDGAQPINVGHVVFFVEELAAVEAFYREVLGFRFPIATSIVRYSCGAAYAVATTTSFIAAAQPQARPEPRGLYRARYP